jgi:hypothetical protein
MSYSKLAAAFVVAALFLGLNAPSADAAVFAHRSAAGFRAKPGPGFGGGFRRSSTTAVRATPFRPAAGPQIFHRSRTAFVR